MADIAAKQFEIRSTLDLTADEYEAEIASADDFLNASDADEISLEAGLIDPATMLPVRVGHLIGGIDEYGLSVQPNSITARIGGRDHMAELLDGRYEKLYLLVQPKAGEEPDMSYAVGSFMASEVAQQVVGYTLVKYLDGSKEFVATGLTLSWECRDYRLQEDFGAVGRPIDILKSLVAPWSQVPMFAVDIYVQGTVVICRPRVATPTPDYTYSVHDARIKNLDISKKRTLRVGTLTLQGKLVPRGMTGTTVIQGSEVEESSVSETKDEAGRVIGRVCKVTTYRMPDRIVLRVREQTYDLQGASLKLMKETGTSNEWEESRYGLSGPANQPKQLGQVNLSSGVDPSDKTKKFRELEKTDVRFSYDVEGFQDLTTTRKWTVSLKTSALDESERIYRTLKDVTQLETEEVTSTYKRGKAGEFFLANQVTNKSAGLRPGGRKPPRTITIGQGDAGPQEPITLERIISAHAWAKDVSYSNPHMVEADLEFIADQFEAASGLWEYRLPFRCVTMPWIKKGKIILFTGLVTAGGTAIPLLPALIIDNRLSYIESSDKPEMVSTISAVFWG